MIKYRNNIITYYLKIGFYNYLRFFWKCRYSRFFRNNYYYYFPLRHYSYLSPSLFVYKGNFDSLKSILFRISGIFILLITVLLFIAVFFINGYNFNGLYFNVVDEFYIFFDVLRLFSIFVIFFYIQAIIATPCGYMLSWSLCGFGKCIRQPFSYKILEDPFFDDFLSNDYLHLNDNYVLLSNLITYFFFLFIIYHILYGIMHIFHLKSDKKNFKNSRETFFYFFISIFLLFIVFFLVNVAIVHCNFNLYNYSLSDNNFFVQLRDFFINLNKKTTFDFNFFIDQFKVQLINDV